MTNKNSENSENFLEVLTFINEMSDSSSSLHKVNVLEKYKHNASVRTALFYTYNKFFNFDTHILNTNQEYTNFFD